jgi:hypothetical protein
MFADCSGRNTKATLLFSLYYESVQTGNSKVVKNIPEILLDSVHLAVINPIVLLAKGCASLGEKFWASGANLPPLHLHHKS